MNICSLASYQLRKIVGCACAGNAGNVFHVTDFKGDRWLAIPACITVRASRTCRDVCRDRQSAVAGKTFPAFPAHAQPVILCIWQEAHDPHWGPLRNWQRTSIKRNADTHHNMLFFQTSKYGKEFNITPNGLVQDCISKSIGNALELLQSCTKPSLCLVSILKPLNIAIFFWNEISYNCVMQCLVRHIHGSSLQ